MQSHPHHLPLQVLNMQQRPPPQGKTNRKEIIPLTVTPLSAHAEGIIGWRSGSVSETAIEEAVSFEGIVRVVHLVQVLTAAERG